MKTAASIFSWLSGILSTLTAIIIMAFGVNMQVYTCKVTSYGTYCGTTTERVFLPGWAWIFVALGVALRLAILIFRQNEAEGEHQVAAGVLTILFVSLIGGILTLCIPREVQRPVYQRRDYSSTISQKEPTITFSKPTQSSLFDHEPHLKYGDRVVLLKDFNTTVGVIPAGSLGTVTVENSKGEPEITFDSPFIRIRLSDAILEKVDKEKEEEKPSNEE